MADSTVINLTPAEVGAEVRARVAVEDTVVDVDTPELQISGTIEVREHAVWLAGPAEVFVAGTGRWVAAGTVPPAQLTVVALELDSDRAAGTGLMVRQLTVDVGGVSIPLTVPADRQYLDLHAGVLVRLPVVAEPLHTRPAATDDFPTDPRPCVALVLDDAVTVEVTADDRRLRASPFVTWLLELAAGAGLDPETDVMRPLRARLAEQVVAVVRETLDTTTDDRVQEPARLLLHVATDPTVTSIEVQVDAEAIRITEIG